MINEIRQISHSYNIDFDQCIVKLIIIIFGISIGIILSKKSKKQKRQQATTQIIISLFVPIIIEFIFQYCKIQYNMQSITNNSWSDLIVLSEQVYQIQNGDISIFIVLVLYILFVSCTTLTIYELVNS